MNAPCCHDGALRSAPEGSPVIAVVGAPNSGKSTLFNALSGARVQEGNWPGTSVEISRSTWHTAARPFDLIDLPGAYSLDPVSPDEAFTRDMLIDAPPDLIIVTVDATALARGLYLVTQLLERNLRVLIAVTKADLAPGINITELATRLDAPVVDVDPRHRRGLDALAPAVEKALAEEPRRRRNAPWGGELDAAEERFGWIAGVVEGSVDKQPERGFSDRLDAVALHPVAGPGLFLAVMWVVFQITTTVAAPLQDWLDGLFAGPVSDALRALPLPRLGEAIIVDGLVAGVGMVLTFVPLMALMFICLAVLEDSGYMARAAVVADRVMRAIGLPGRAFLPLIVGFGCNVPAISATRILGKREHRILTALLIPFASCTARLAVYVMLATTFFPDRAGTVVFAMYVISVLLIVVVGMAVRRLLWRSFGSEPLVIDLPRYQLPGARMVTRMTWTRLAGFLKTASTIIVACVAIVFLLQATPVRGDHEFGDPDLAVADSAYGVTAEAMAPIFAPAGFGSGAITGALITGFVAKEAVISTWAQTYPDEELSTAITRDFEETSGGHALAAVWAFMMFLLAYTPCVATLAAQRREIGLPWTLAGVVLQLGVAWLLAVGTFQLLSVWL
ncbi:MAG: ferrous iron transport protein B [Corynebacterium sp.]|uniref:ferrous iron transport protein B n=1 Tax=Corynebacterium sp. TaxID=1720 RepID=UPI0026E07C69|nr:ferrous iron transport protein B [Corynebacterium sp.]MDO5669505.1 ferrous iron transport protein B [Corynebacterium sp.]